MKSHKISLIAFAAIAAISSSSTAMAQCTGTGNVAALTPFLPFSSGSAVNSLVSAINTANTVFLTQSTAFVGAPGNPRPNQEGGGVWVRGIGGDIDTKSTTATSNVVLAGTPVVGSVACASETNLRFTGVQAGTDMARLNWNGWNVHVGSTVGYLSARAKDTTAVGPLNPLGGSLVDDLEIPFVGIYAAATYGSFFIDGQLRWDYYQNSLNDPIVSGLFNQKLNARGLTFTGNIGYNWALGNGWFLEPSAGIVVSRVEVDPLSIAGTLFLPAAFSPFVNFPGSLQVGDIDSTLGRLSLRTGTTIVTDRVIWQPFATASVYHEFADDVTSTFTGLPPPLDFTGSLTTSRIGTYGQFGLGVAGQLVNSGWLGYFRADYRTGDNIEGYSLNGGIRYQFTPEGLPLAPKGLITKAPVVVATGYNWTGFHIGVHAGGVSGWSDQTFVPANLEVEPKFGGALAGGQIGYDYQIGKWVLGIEGTGAWSNASGARGCPGQSAGVPVAFFLNCEAKLDWLVTGVAKIGYAYWDRAMIYVKGGVAAGEVTAQVTCNTGTLALLGGIALPSCNVPNAAGQLAGFEAAKSTKVGWTIGYGTEFTLTKDWTVIGETTYFDLGRERFTTPTYAIDTKTTGITATVGLNYRFATR